MPQLTVLWGMKGAFVLAKAAFSVTDHKKVHTLLYRMGD